MKQQNDNGEVRERPRENLPSGANEPRAEPAIADRTRSDPLKSTYDSTFIVLVLSIAAILAVVLWVWPFGGL